MVDHFDDDSRRLGYDRQGALALMGRNSACLILDQGTRMSEAIDRLANLGAQQIAMNQRGAFARVTALATGADREIKLLPATLAVVASIFTAAVSLLSVRLQRESAAKIEALKSDFQKDLERFRRRLNLAGADADKAKQMLDRVRSSASSYHAELKRLETGHFSPVKAAEAEKAAEAMGGEIPRDASYLAAWYRFWQQGYCMSDLAKRKNSTAERRSIWQEEGRLLSEQFEAVIEQVRQDEADIRERELASDAATESA
ncbi:DUF2937 family protein [Bradyrhizobium japonicum]|uniref:DUF2937 family protein n=1 Tax=Bradyrhizobium japonicum TaxID=375 RepID=UPI0024B775DF|nr:DUF2937 family protein [Bradyrhizobium japonicum]